MHSWILKRQPARREKSRQSEGGVGKEEELCCSCVACFVSVTPRVEPQSVGTVAFGLLAWMRQQRAKGDCRPSKKCCCVLDLVEASPWGERVLLRAFF